MKKIFTLMIALCLSVGAWAQSFEVDGIYYRVTSDVEPYAVEIHNNNYNIVYSGEIYIPASVSYENKTYSVTGIMGHVFEYNPNLRAINVDDANTAYSSIDGVLYNKDKTELIYYPDAKEGVTFTIPMSVTNIYAYAIRRYTKLEEIILQNPEPPILSYGNFGENIIITVPVNSKVDYEAADNWIEFNIREVDEVIYVGAKFSDISNGNEIFYRITSIDSKTVAVIENPSKYSGSISIPTNVTFEGDSYEVTRIWQDAFRGCEELTAITMPNTIKRIDERAFAFCTSLTSVVIPNLVTDINVGTFWGCTSLTSVTLPSSIYRIEGNAFANCYALTEVTYLATIPMIIDNFENGEIFNNVPLTNVTLKVPQGCIDNYQYEYIWGDFGTIVELTPIEDGETFSANGINYKVTSQSPNNVEVIGGNTTKSGSAYSGVVNIPSSVVYKDIDFSVTAIAAKAFSNSAVTEVEIPSTVETIGDEAFSGCTNLTKVTTLAVMQPTLGTDVFSGVNTSSVTLFVPSGTESTYQGTPQWQDFNIETSTSTNINELQAKQPFVQRGSTLVFSQDTNIAIYSISGACIYKGTTQSYTLPYAGMYIVSTKEGNYKVLNK